jgi:hypothetical protein
MVSRKLPPPEFLARDCIREQSQASVPVVIPAVPARKRRMSLQEANARALELAQRDRDFVHKPLRAWAQSIGCSTGLVTRLTLWIQYQHLKRLQKRGPGKRPPTVSLTPELEAVLGSGDREAAIRWLIAEQRADFEPSPLDPEPRVVVRVRKRL